LQIDDEVGRGLAADFGDGIGFGIVVDGDANDIGAGGSERIDLADRGVDIARLRGRHALHGDRVAGADRDRADADGASLVTGNLH
jgi:hypothetical protein